MHEPRKPPAIIIAGMAILVVALACLFDVADVTAVVAGHL
jgi:hypothetical protein